MVEQRPKDTIAVAIVETIDLLLCEKHRVAVVLAQLAFDSRSLGLAQGVAWQTRPANPAVAAGTHVRSQTRS